jgi:hypothetical protein
MQREIAELNRLKQIKNRKYSWQGQMAVYSQPVEVTLYLTFQRVNVADFPRYLYPLQVIKLPNPQLWVLPCPSTSPLP